jgi:hypothetical protein
MRRALALICIIVTGWFLGWINRDIQQNWSWGDALPFSRTQGHTGTYNLLCLAAITLFALGVARLPRPQSALAHVAWNFRTGSVAKGFCSVILLVAVLWLSRWIGEHARVPQNIFDLPLTDVIPYWARLEVVQSLSAYAILTCTYLLLVIYARHRLQVEQEKRKALDLSFALAQRKQGVPVPLPEGENDTEPLGPQGPPKHPQPNGMQPSQK